MGHRRDEKVHRLLIALKWMMAVNLVLVGLVVMLAIKTVALNRQVDQLTAQLETVPSQSFGDISGEHSAESVSAGSEDMEANASNAPETGEAGEVTGTTGQDISGESEEETAEPELRDYIVCLDAGHGGPQGKGAISSLDGRIESHDTLKLTLAVQAALEKYEDVTVVMTRTEDVEVDNGVRAQIANDADADLFVSFHRNSNTSGDRGGIEGWIHSSNPEDSRAAGELILAAMEEVGVTYNYGVKSGTWDEPDVNYKIIRLAEMPAVLLEVGYLNYAKDNALYDQNYEAYARATAEAIYTWLKDWVER